jgi:formate dehydrogenase subunit gamma
MDLSEILAAHASGEGQLLPILHDVQATFGWVSEDAIRAIALHLNLSRAEVSGVVSFYHDFRRTPDPRPAIRLCRAESCQSRGSEALAAHAERIAGERVRVETVYCLGLCTVGPNAMIGDEVFARLDDAQVAALVRSL